METDYVQESCQKRRLGAVVWLGRLALTLEGLSCIVDVLHNLCLLLYNLYWLSLSLTLFHLILILLIACRILHSRTRIVGH
jgi:hypothetical protein